MQAADRLSSWISWCLSLVVALSLLGAPAAHAQRDGVVAGRILDSEGNPVAGVRVLVVSLERGDERELQTDDEGNYMGRGFRPENYAVRVHADGFAPAEAQVRVRLGMNTVDFTLTPESTAGPGVDYEGLNALYDQGFKAFQRKDWPAAQAAISELLADLGEVEGEEAATMRKSAYEILGVAHLEQGQVDESITVYETLLAIDADSLAGHTWIAQAFTRKGDYQSAAVHLKRAAELAPDDSNVQYNAGAVMLQIGEVEAGIAAMERALELRPDFPVARKNLGYAYLRTQEYEKSLAMLKGYLEQLPDAPDRAEIEQMIKALEEQIGQQ